MNAYHLINTFTPNNRRQQEERSNPGMLKNRVLEISRTKVDMCQKKKKKHNQRFGFISDDDGRSVDFDLAVRNSLRSMSEY